MKELTELRNKVLYLRNTEELSVKGELILLHKLNALKEAINYTRCCTEFCDCGIKYADKYAVQNGKKMCIKCAGY
jgi:hypothetical protein